MKVCKMKEKYNKNILFYFWDDLIWSISIRENIDFIKVTMDII